MTLEERIKNTVKTKGFAYKECLGVDGFCCLVGSNAGPGACALNIRRATRKKEEKETWRKQSNIKSKMHHRSINFWRGVI